MSKPDYVVRIKGKDVDCLGEQLVQILETIEALIPEIIWYGADVETNGDRPWGLGLNGPIPKKIGTTKDLIKMSKGVDQFQRGVFLAFSEDQGRQLSEELDTEDREFRNMGKAIIEIRAFDTSYFEIYAHDFELIHKIARGFYGIVERNPEKVRLIEELKSE